MGEHELQRHSPAQRQIRRLEVALWHAIPFRALRTDNERDTLAQERLLDKSVRLDLHPAEVAQLTVGKSNHGPLKQWLTSRDHQSDGPLPHLILRRKGYPRRH